MGITKFVGSSVRRREDGRLLRGAGRFVADISLPGMLHMAVVRSSRPHAQIKGIHRAAALGQAGVVLVLDGAELDTSVGPLPSIDLFPDSKPALMRALALNRVRYVGEPIAIVVATHLEAARAAAKAVEIDYEDLPVLLDPEEAALNPQAPLLYEEYGTNIANTCLQEVGDVATAFAGAQHVMDAEFRIHRCAPAPMETRGALAEPDEDGSRFTLYTSTQFPHLVRAFLSGVLNLDQSLIRVVAPDVGGGFGAKCEFYPEEVLTVIACLRLKQPVRWIETRSESFLATTQAREQIHRVRAAYNSDGIVSAIELNSITNNGAAMATLSTTPASISSAMFRGPYRIPHYRARSLSVLTNKTPLAVYRGAGHPQAVLCMEQIMDRIAAQLGMDRMELRRRNMLTPAELPSDRGTAIVLAGKVVYDSGDYPEALQRAADLFKLRDRQAKQASARKEGRLLGLGIACLVEETAIGPYETGQVAIDAAGKVTVLTGASPHGQGTATAIAQLVAEELQTSLHCVVVKHGDTEVVKDGLGTFASRGGPVAGAAARLAARRVKEKALSIAAEMLGASEADLEWAEGGVRIRNRRGPTLSLAALARQAELTSVKLEESVTHQVPGIAFANGVHMAEVEIDGETGQLKVTGYAAVHDCGVVINPMIVEGQVVGGIAQGLGATLFEELRYDEAGYPLNTGFQTYLLPTAADIPDILTGSMESPSPLNPFGMKGAGEGGTVGGVGSIHSAIADALAPLGIRLSGDGPFTPPTLLRLIQSAQGSRERVVSSQPRL